MQPGDVLFVRNPWSFAHPADDAIKLGEVIRDHALNGYTHVCIVLGNGKVAEAQGGRLSGVNDLSVYDGNYDVGHAKVTDAQRPLIVAQAQKDYGFTYDWHLIDELGEHILDGESTNLPDVPDEYICTTFVKHIFKAAIGAEFGCGDTPEELSRDPLFEIERVMKG